MVTLGYQLAAALPELQAAATSRMTDTVTVGLYEDGTDETTGDPTLVLKAQRYAGKGRVRWGSREVTNAVSPGMPTTVQEPYLSVPFGSPRLHVDDTVIINASPDPLLTGRSFRVAGAPAAGQVTAHRYPLEELD